LCAGPGERCDPAAGGCVPYGSSSNPGVSCRHILTVVPSMPDGVYWLDPLLSREPFQAYCDMTRDGGGWTLVLQNNSWLTPGPDPSYAEVVNNVNVTGTFGSDLTAFDLFLGLAFWMPLGAELRLEVGPDPDTRVNQAIYPFTLDVGDWSISFGSGGRVTVGTEEPGLKLDAAANGWPMTTRDHDADPSPGNCAIDFGYAWWYGGCWSGSFWGSRRGGYQDASYWVSTTVSHAYGAIWVR
jgi:hypothetical protein